MPFLPLQALEALTLRPTVTWRPIVCQTHTARRSPPQLPQPPSNDITPRHYYRLPDVLGSGRGFVVETVEHLDAALAAARAHTQSFCLLDVRLDPRGISPALRRLTERLAQQQGHANMRQS
jgi:hypothetical protein